MGDPNKRKKEKIIFQFKFFYYFEIRKKKKEKELTSGSSVQPIIEIVKTVIAAWPASGEITILPDDGLRPTLIWRVPQPVLFWESIT